MYAAKKFYSENIPREPHISSQYASPRQSSPSPDLTLLFSLTLLTTIVMMLAVFSLPKHTLENHPMCGTTTGGKDECYFDCSLVSCVQNYGTLVEDLSCISDCFENEPENCVTSLLNDVKRLGVCNSTNPDGYDSGPGIYPISELCEVKFDVIELTSEIVQGTCSDKTEALLLTDKCRKVVFEQQSFILVTIDTLINLSCRREISKNYFDFAIDNNLNFNLNRKGGSTKQNMITEKLRLAPVQIILEDLNIKTKLQYENTRNRYPWTCSLRSTGPSPVHRCAVNLLSIPPSPTVLVGAAHCTYLCKDGSREVPVCCCSFRTDQCRDTDPKCGENPEVFEMTGEDSVLVCGEWDTSQAMSLSSGEQYNVKLPIIEIVRHPGFDPEIGPLNGNDIVIFKVDDSKLQNNVANDFQLWPACLPPQSVKSPKTGIHTGWSQPPPFPFVQSQASGFARHYDDFYKQWHYKMDIFNTCEDPKESVLCGATLDFPSNSSYPAGTVCAKDFTRKSCFSTGDSGSPLMVKSDESKYYIEGILSFVKGCDRFAFGSYNEITENPTFILTQQSENPTTYTKLKCFLPWIADQYNMRYEVTGIEDQACLSGSGDPEDGRNQCRNTHSQWADGLEEAEELDCIFPFYYNGRKYNECILFNEEDFLYPVFRCPIRNITTKIDGINSFVSSSLTEGYCLSDPFDEQSELDPEFPCFFLGIRQPFSQCKNNCPGVRAFGIIGGGAILAGLATVGVLTTASFALPAVAAGVIGVAGIGGGMLVAQNTCAGPLFCISASGRCCVVVNSGNGFVCPDTCRVFGP